MKLALIACGGTINSVPSGQSGSLRPAQNAQDFLDHIPELRGMVDFEVLQFGNIDSSQADPTVWTKLAMFVHKHKANYDAIVITHGTDTMAESAAAMSFVFANNLNLPIVFTGSQLPVVSRQTDARNNLVGAFKVALKAIAENVAEVMVYFDNKVFRGNRMWKQSEVAFDAFTSGTFPLLASINAAPTWDTEDEQHWSMPVFHPLAIQKKEVLAPDFHPQFGEGVVVTDLYAGTPPEFWIDGLRGGSCKGLILKTMGAGNIPYINPRYDMRPVIKVALENGIPVLVSLKFPNGMVRSTAIYEAGQVALEAGAIPTGDMVHEAAYVKLLYLIGLGHRTPDAVRKFMLTPMAGEVTEL